ncbi:MAG: hypothetical protein ACP5PV_13190 [Methanothrix sp.]|jgi:hypothetical protein
MTIRLNEPKDIRRLIRDWIREVSETGQLPFQNGGVIVQLLNTWLKSYELEKIPELETRIKELEEHQEMGQKRGYRGR